MIRPVDLLLASLVVGGAVWTYSIKHEAEEAADRVSALRAAIKAEEERIMFLRADWAFLNAPARLEGLVKRHGEDLKLVPLAAPQIVRPSELPPPRPDPADETLADGDAAGEGGDFTTGSIAPPTSSPSRSIDAILDAAPAGSIDDLLGGSQ